MTRRIQDKSLFQMTLYTVQSIVYLFNSSHVMHNPPNSQSTFLHWEEKKGKAVRGVIQNSIKCSWITFCANGQRLPDNVFMYQQGDARSGSTKCLHCSLEVKFHPALLKTFLAVLLRHDKKPFTLLFFLCREINIERGKTRRCILTSENCCNTVMWEYNNVILPLRGRWTENQMGRGKKQWQRDQSYWSFAQGFPVVSKFSLPLEAVVPMKPECLSKAVTWLIAGNSKCG